jgi:hypothetical protein
VSDPGEQRRQIMDKNLEHLAAVLKNYLADIGPRDKMIQIKLSINFARALVKSCADLATVANLLCRQAWKEGFDAENVTDMAFSDAITEANCMNDEDPDPAE